MEKTCVNLCDMRPVGRKETFCKMGFGSFGSKENAGSRPVSREEFGGGVLGSHRREVASEFDDHRERTSLYDVAAKTIRAGCFSGTKRNHKVTEIIWMANRGGRGRGAGRNFFHSSFVYLSSSGASYTS